MQVAGSISSIYSVGMASEVRGFFANINFVEVDFVSVLGLGCVNLGLGFYASFIISTLIVYTFVALLFALYNIAAHMNHRKIRRHKEQNMPWHELMRFVAKTQDAHKKRKAKFFQAAAMLLSAMYMPITMKSFRIFQCKIIDGRSYLVADFRQLCYTADWYLYASIAVAVIISYAFAYPIVIVRILWRRRRNLQKRATKDRIGFLYEDFRSDAFIFSIVPMLRKLALAAAPVYLYRFPTIQLAYSGVVSVGFHLLYASVQPFDDKAMNYVVGVTLLAAWMSFFLLLMQNSLSQSQDYDQAEAANSLVIAVNIAVFVFAALMLGVSLRASFKTIAEFRKRDHDVTKVKESLRLGMRSWANRSKAVLHAKQLTGRSNISSVKVVPENAHERDAAKAQSMHEHHEMLLKRMVSNRHAGSQRRTADRLKARIELRKKRVLQKVDAFEGLEAGVIAKIVGKMEMEFAEEGDAIVRQGEVAEKFYVLIEGSAKVMVKFEGAAQATQVHEFKGSDPFGENAIVGDTPGKRTASVIATSPCKLMSLSRQNFLAVMKTSAKKHNSSMHIQRKMSIRQKQNQENHAKIRSASIKAPPPLQG